MCLLYTFAFLTIFIALFINIQGNLYKTWTGLHQDNPRLVETITKRFLVSPNLTKDYNLTRHQANHLNILGAQSFTSLMADLCQDINRDSSFSRCLNGTFP